MSKSKSTLGYIHLKIFTQKKFRNIFTIQKQLLYLQYVYPNGLNGCDLEKQAKVINIWVKWEGK